MTAHHHSATPVGRSIGLERTLLLVIGLLTLLAGIAALIVGTGVLGTFRAKRAVLDPMIVQWWTDSPGIAIPLGIVLGLVLFLLGIWWLLRTLSPEPRPDLRLETNFTGGLTVTSAALTETVRTDAEAVTGVQRARVRTAGSQRNPTLRVTLSLRQGTDVREVWEELDTKILSRARRALGTDSLPSAIHLRLDRAPRQRVR